MTNNETKVAAKCRECKMGFMMNANPDKQYQWEEAGYCCYGCMAKADDRYNRIDRYARY